MRRKRPAISPGVMSKSTCRASGGPSFASSQPWLWRHHCSSVSARLKGWDPLDISFVCVPYQGDVTRWGYALGPQAFLDQGLGQRLEERGHRVSQTLWIDLPSEERTRDTVTNLGCLAERTSAAVSAALRRGD